MRFEKVVRERNSASQENFGQKNCSLEKEYRKLKSSVENCENMFATLKGEKDLCALKLKSLESDLREANRKLGIANAKINYVTFAIQNLEESL